MDRESTKRESLRRGEEPVPEIEDKEALRARAIDLLRRGGYGVRQVQPAGEGSHHHLFVVEIDDGPMQLLRLPRHNAETRLSPVLQSEAEAILRARHEIPVPHPSVLLPTVHEPEGALMPILPGERAIALRDERAQLDVTRICMELGQCLAKLHRIRRCVGEPTVIRSVLPDSADARPSLLHGDAHLGNLLVEEDPRQGWKITGVVDWSFCAWGPPEVDLVEMAICEAEPRPHLGRVFYESYVASGGLPPREPVFREALMRELQRRLREHVQAHDPAARDRWTQWLDGLRRPAAISTRVFEVGRGPGRELF
jgi:aminoglycoside phosphotransferase (APT) family kinase protein